MWNDLYATLSQLFVPSQIFDPFYSGNGLTIEDDSLWVADNSLLTMYGVTSSKIYCTYGNVTVSNNTYLCYPLSTTRITTSQTSSTVSGDIIYISSE